MLFMMALLRGLSFHTLMLTPHCIQCTNMAALPNISRSHLAVFSGVDLLHQYVLFTNSTVVEVLEMLVEGYTGTLSHLWEVVWLDTQLQIN